MGPESTKLEAMPASAAGEGEELPPLAEEELPAVEAVFASLEKTSRVYRLYPPNNKIFIDFTEELAGRLQSFLREHQELELSVLSDRIEYKERTVYEGKREATSLARKLFRDGVRKLVLYDGLEKGEVLDLLDVFTHQPDPDSLEDDMVTLLWEKDLSHVSYFVLDDPFEDEELPDLKKSVKQVEEPLAPGKPRKDPYIAPKLSAQTLSRVLTITDHDLEAVKAMIAQENSRNLRHDLTTLLFEMLNIRQEEEAFRNSIGILGRLVRSYVSTGSLGEAVAILRKFREHLGGDLSEALRACIRAELERISGPEVLEEVGKLFEQPILKNTREVREFLRLSGPAVIDALVGFLPRARNVQVLAAVLLDLGRERPEKLIERLSDPDPVVVRHVIGILGSMKDPSLVPHLLPHLEQPAVVVRLEAVRALGRIGGSAATEGLLRAVRDAEYQVRTHALRSIAENGTAEIAPALREIVADREFLHRNLYEKQEFYRTLARIEPAETLALLAEILERTSFFKRSRTDENRAAAASALGYLRDPQARAILERHVKSTSRAVREACQMAIRRLDQDEPREPEEEPDAPA